MKKVLTILIIIAALGVGAFLLPKKTNHEITIKTKIPEINTSASQLGTSQSNVSQSNSQDMLVPNKVLISVPFTSQAPFANWSDPNEESGCEEASMIMAWHWIKNDIQGQTIDQQQAEN